jgi:hypothetical protein
VFLANPARLFPDVYAQVPSTGFHGGATLSTRGLDIWDDAGQGVVEHVTGVDDFKVAEATYRAAIARWPTVRIMLRQGARVVHESRATSEV